MDKGYDYIYDSIQYDSIQYDSIQYDTTIRTIRNTTITTGLWMFEEYLFYYMDLIRSGCFCYLSNDYINKIILYTILLSNLEK
jgi:hypothetical protein